MKPLRDAGEVHDLVAKGINGKMRLVPSEPPSRPGEGRLGFAPDAQPFEHQHEPNMKAKSNRDKRRTVLQVNENLSLEEQIAQRAHDLWHQRGRAHGSDMDDWLQAEREINERHQKRMQGKSSLRHDHISA